jgi:hypothetical protein
MATNPCHRHLGLYAHKADLLERFAKLPLGCPEQIEKLEQLRVLENDYDIAVGFTTDPTIDVDTPEDAVRFEQLLAAKEQGSNINIAGNLAAVFLLLDTCNLILCPAQIFPALRASIIRWKSTK